MSDSPLPITGGCGCGAVRYSLTVPPDEVLVCHCPDCRRALGAHAVAWLLLPVSGFLITRGAPACWRSSPGVERGFCADCGTTLTWIGDQQPGRIDVTLGSLDRPEQLTPQRDVYRRHRLPWVGLIG